MYEQRFHSWIYLLSCKLSYAEWHNSPFENWKSCHVLVDANGVINYYSKNMNISMEHFNECNKNKSIDSRVWCIFCCIHSLHFRKKKKRKKKWF